MEEENSRQKRQIKGEGIKKREIIKREGRKKRKIDGEIQKKRKIEGDGRRKREIGPQKKEELKKAWVLVFCSIIAIQKMEKFRRQQQCLEKKIFLKTPKMLSYE